jgi:uncharacterized FlgJ-related protein
MLKNHFLKNFVIESYQLSMTALQVRLRQKLAITALRNRREDLRKQGQDITGRTLIRHYLYFNAQTHNWEIVDYAIAPHVGNLYYVNRICSAY